MYLKKFKEENRWNRKGMEKRRNFMNFWKIIMNFQKMEEGKKIPD